MKIKYDDDKGENYKDKEKRKEACTVECQCGHRTLLVNYIPAPYTGCYLKVTCGICGHSQVIFDDYS